MRTAKKTGAMTDLCARAFRPPHQIAAAVDGLLCGLAGKIIARLEENCKRLLGCDFLLPEAMGDVFR